jgi:hypothetical protein
LTPELFPMPPPDWSSEDTIHKFRSEAAMPAAVDQPIGGVSAQASCQRQRSGADAADRRAVHELAFLGSRRMTVMLRTQGERINRKRVQGLMRKMGIAALGPKPRTTKPAPGHKILRISCAG